MVSHKRCLLLIKLLLVQLHIINNFKMTYSRKDKITGKFKYLLVLEYADGGTLSGHLKKNFDKIDWTIKFCLAQEISSAVMYLHGLDIVH